MNARWPLLLIPALLLAAVFSTFAATDIVVDVRPGTLLIGGGGDFKVRGTSDTGIGRLNEVEENSSLSTFPNIRLGVGFEEGKSITDVTGLLGVMVNQRFRSLMVGGDASWLYKFRKNVAMGPHLGAVVLTQPEWSGDAEVTFSDSWAMLGGFQMSVGYDILFVFSIDYLLAQPFDVTTEGDWVASDEELDVSGVAIQFGIRGRF
ncbi:MAG TPA: hypothetical protein PLE77_11320 [Kiritimatiellia bacterium]|nr:hypothetical protein [Kiritimatiellia bacterium]